MERLDHDDTCQLSLAGDLICMMVDGLCELDAIEKCIDEVKRAERSIEVNAVGWLPTPTPAEWSVLFSRADGLRMASGT
jgi:hypothetical protein